jgi:two-component system, OmpR family, response regulator ChvI
MRSEVLSRSVVIVDDDPAVLKTLDSTLSAEEFEVRTFQDGQDAIRALQQKPAAVAILDIKMPRMDGLQLLEQLRKFSAMPVIFLTSRDAEVDEVFGLRMGADDYIRKPASPRLVTERVRALLRRIELLATESEGKRAVHHGDLTLDPDTHRCLWQGKPVDLTVTEFLILTSLVRRPGHVRNREQLMSDAYPDNAYVDDRTIDSHMKRIRRKFAQVVPHFDQIETLYGVGYRYRE